MFNVLQEVGKWMLSSKESSDFNNHFFFEDLVDQYGEELMRLAYTYVKNKQAAEDIIQDVFLRAYEKREAFKGHSTYRTYLYRMTINRCYDHLRSWSYKNVRISEKIISFFKIGNSTEGDVITNDDRNRIGKEDLS